MSKITIKFPSLHAGQSAVRSHPARFQVLACGRRWGKTMLGSLLCVAAACRGDLAWWVAPSYKMAVPGWRGITRLAHQIPGAQVRPTDRSVLLPSGGMVVVRSADDPQSLRGEGLDLVVLDECAYMKIAVWREVLRPALSDRLGRAIFISTPRGRNWYHKLWLQGQGDNPDWQSWQRPTSDNPFINPKEIEIARADLPATTFRQEYLAEFIENGGIVFRNVRACTYDTPPQIEARQYVMGVDWAQSEDYTVLTVIDPLTRTVFPQNRFNQIGWSVQRGRLRAMVNRFGDVSILAEANSIGGPNVEALQAEGLDVRAFTTTSESKARIIQALVLAFEREEIRIPNDAALISELEAFEAVRLPSGRWRYAAPEGMHDDRVISLALAWWHMHNRPVSLPVSISRVA